MEAIPLTRKRSVRFLFLGDVVTDRRVKNFIRYFQSREWYVELLCSTKHLVPEGLQKELNARVHELKHLGGPRMFLEHHRSLVSQLRELPPLDVTVACELYSLSAGKYARTKRMSIHLAYDSREVYTGLPTIAGKPLVRTFWKTIERRGLKLTDSIIVTGSLDAVAIRNEHKMLPRDFLIRNIPMRTAKPSRNDYLRDRLKIPHDKSILIYVGGIQSDRGLEQMIVAMKSLQNEAVFVVIGEGILLDNLKALTKTTGLEAAVKFLGAVPSDQALFIMASADVGVVLIDTRSPSYSLALPSKLYEYLFAGLPVLASPMKQAVDEFKEHPAVRFVDTFDENAIVNAIRDLIHLSHDSNRMSTLQDDILKTLSFESDAAPFADYLEHLIK